MNIANEICMDEPVARNLFDKMDGLRNPHQPDVFYALCPTLSSDDLSPEQRGATIARPGLLPHAFDLRLAPHPDLFDVIISRQLRKPHPTTALSAPGAMT